MDANIVIDAYKLNVWDHLIDKCDVVLPSIIARDEAKFYYKDQVSKGIDLGALISTGKIQEIEATGTELIEISLLFDPVFIRGLHRGELEALALIKNDKAAGALFCTGDAKAIKALAMLGLSERGISMEILLSKFGLQKQLDFWLKEDYFQKRLKEGSINLIQGTGLAP